MGIRNILIWNFVGNLIVPGILGVVFVNMTNVGFPYGIIAGILVLSLILIIVSKDRRFCLRLIFGSQVTMFMQYIPIVQFAVGVIGIFVFEALLKYSFIVHGFRNDVGLANTVVFGLTIQCGLMMGGIAYLIGDRWRRIFGPNQSRVRT